MIIDFHTHTFPERIAERAVEKLSAASHTVNFTNGTTNALRASMKEAGIDTSVVLQVSTNPAKVESVNNASIEQNDGGSVIFFGCMHPEYPSPAAEIRRLAEAGIRGIKLHPVYQGVDLDDVRYLRILNAAGEYGMTVVTHSGYDIGFPGVVHCSPDMVRSALRQVGAVKLVLAHMGGWRCWDEVSEKLADTGAYIDTSFSLGRLTPTEQGYYSGEELSMMSAEQFVNIVRSFGADRVVFGTDSPWSEQKAYLDAFLSLPLTYDEKEKIMHKNAEALLGRI